MEIMMVVGLERMEATFSGTLLLKCIVGVLVGCVRTALCSDSMLFSIKSSIKSSIMCSQTVDR